MTGEMAAVMNQEDSDSEYQDAQEDFHHVKNGTGRNTTERLRQEVLPLPLPTPVPVAPPRVKRNKKKQLEKERGLKDGPGEGATEKVLPSSKSPDLNSLPSALADERMMDTQDSVDSDPSVTIKEEGLLMNPELLQTIQVTVTSETPMKRSGRVAGEYRESIVSSSDSDEESAGRDGDGTLKEMESVDKKDATAQKKETEGAQASLSDSEILQLVMVKNLDTGECKPLSEVEKIAPKGTDPISLHIMKLTSDFVSSEDSRPVDATGPRKKPRKKLKNLFRKGKHDDRSTLEGAGPHSDEDAQGEGQPEAPMAIKYRPAHHFKGPYDFAETRLKQALVGEYQHVVCWDTWAPYTEHPDRLDAIWTMKFSICGRLLATGGQDNTVRVWVLRSAYQFFHDLQVRYARVGASADSLSSKSTSSSQTSQDSEVEEDPSKPFKEKPLCIYTGHRADVLDMSWSKNFFLLSSSMDKTVKLWHISRKECLCCFQHSEFVTSIAFHPRDDRYFLSGSLDGKLRLWNIPDKKVALWNEIEGVGSKLITAANFCGKGKYVVVGTYDGRCLFYDTEHLKYHTQIQVRSRHGKNAKGRKISGLEPLLGEDKLLVTSNDSRIRLYNLKDHSLICKFKGCVNNSSQIKASFNHDAKFIICGSEDHTMYLWRTYNASRLPSGRRDRNDFFECISAHSAVVTVAIFAPVPGLFANEGLREVGEVIVSADYQGGIKVFVCGPDL